MYFRLPISIFIILCMNSVYAEIYTCKDAEGKTIYTDSPGGCSDAEEVKVDDLPTLIPTKPITTTSGSKTNTFEQEEKDPYTALTITSPANDSSVRDNQGNMTINFQAMPGLQTRKGHKFIVTVDGTEVYSGTSTITALKNVDRGTHTIGVKIVDADGSTKISATPVKFTLQRYSALQSNTSNDSGDEGDPVSNQNHFKFPGSTKLPTRPPPKVPAN